MELVYEEREDEHAIFVYIETNPHHRDFIGQVSYDSRAIDRIRACGREITGANQGFMEDKVLPF